MDYLVSARTHAHIVAKTADTLGVDLPDVYVEQVAHVEIFAEAAAKISQAKAGDLHAAVFHCLETGRDYGSDPTVQRLMLDRLLATQGLEAAARAHAEYQLATALSENADAILDVFADALESHSAAMVAAAAAVPSLDLESTDSAVGRGDAVFAHWTNAVTAAKAWEAARSAFASLAAVSGVSYSERTMPLIYTPARAVDLAALYETTRPEKITPLILAKNGNPLMLATVGAFMERVALFEADRQAVQRDYAARRQEAGFNTR